MDLAFYVRLHDSCRTGRAVIEEEIIPVDSVFRPVIDEQGLPDPVLRDGVEVQHLFRHFASPHFVFDHKVAEVFHTQSVIRFPFGKAVNEVRFGKREDPVVEHRIDLLCRVLHPERRMPVNRINRIVRR